jgi:CBS domain-containing protein
MDTTVTPRKSGDQEMRESKQMPQAQQQQTGLDQLLLYFARFPLDQLSPRSTTGTIRLWKSGNAVTVRDDERVSRIFFKLVTEGFLSAPVLDQRGRFVGTIDLLDLASFTVDLFDESKLQPTEDQWTFFLEKEHKFWDAKATDVLAKKRKQDSQPIFRGNSVLQAMEVFSSTGVHRLPVLDEFQNIVGICTQSMIVSLLSQGIDMMGDVRNIPVSAMHSDLCKEVFTIKEDAKALEAFRLMIEKNVYGIAVVDNEGALVDNLSVRDLRGIGTNAAKFKRLYMPIKQFKELVRQEYPSQTPKLPITVNDNDTFEKVVRLMDDGNIHRVFEVQPIQQTAVGTGAGQQQQQQRVRPVHVISQIDVIKFVLKRAGVPVREAIEQQGRDTQQQQAQQPQQQQQGQQGQGPSAATGSAATATSMMPPPSPSQSQGQSQGQGMQGTRAAMDTSTATS